MANMIDYIAWRGDISLVERPFNEVDNLVLAELAYAPFEDIVPGPGQGGSIELRAAAQRYSALHRATDLINDPGPLLAAAGASARFGSARLCAYVNRVAPSEQVQFSAVTFLLSDGTLYAAYRGTDSSIVGWREDFNFSFTETPGQLEAADYLNRAAAANPGAIRVGGHSKGGNLAAYAAAFCAPEVKARILEIYSNDGPGFNQAIADSEAYRSVLDRVRLIIPETTLIGILLNNHAKRRVIRSSASGVMQHNPLTWQVRGTAFETAESQSDASLFADETMRRWLNGLDEAQRQDFVSAIFDAMDASGAETLPQLNENRWERYGAMLKALADIAPDRRRELLNTLKKLGDAGLGVLRQDARAALGQLAAQAAARLSSGSDDPDKEA